MGGKACGESGFEGELLSDGVKGSGDSNEDVLVGNGMVGEMAVPLAGEELEQEGGSGEGAEAESGRDVA